jgi:hypothetical protein
MTSDEAFMRLEVLKLQGDERVPPGDSFTQIALARMTACLGKVENVPELLGLIRAGLVCLKAGVFTRQQLDSEVRQMLLESIFDTP